MDTSVILDSLLEAKGAPVSGDRLARALGVSRVSVWGRLQQLRREGFEFVATPRVGYRLTATPRVVHGGLIAAWLRRFAAAGAAANGVDGNADGMAVVDGGDNRATVRPPDASSAVPARAAAPAMAVHAFAQVDSTNDEAGRRLGAGEAAPFAVFASAQTGGRGRRGRVWESHDSGNLYMSFAFRPLFTRDNMQSVTLAVGLALCETLTARCGVPLQIKWPNDLLCGGRKVAGILAEARMDCDQMRDIVLGVGLNVNGHIADFPAELRTRAGTLAAAAGREFDLNETAALCAATVGAAFDDFLRNGRGADFDARWERFDFLRGKMVRASGGGRDLAGLALGLAPNGGLRVRDRAGCEHVLDSGEVTLSGAEGKAVRAVPNWSHS